MLKILLALKSPSEAIMALIGAYRVDMLKENESLPKAVTKNSYDLILLEGETDVLPSIKAIDPRVEVILFGHREDDVFESIKQGAYAYFLFPVEIENLKKTIDSISEMVVIRQENAKLERQLSTHYTFFSGVVGRNPQMLDIFTLLRRIAPYYKIVTIMGETGTGKEVIAKALHSLSPYSKNPFIVCDCGAIVETLVESELFGHKKGSFTGAIADKKGFFEAAGGGVLFLDEISELPFSSQASLLRVLQSCEFRRVGDYQLLKAKCGVIAATNKDLQEQVKSGSFREDLFYRITPLTIYVPPLRERKDDILLLCRFFLDRLNSRTGKEVLGISRPAQTVMMSYDWPGNVRELENVVEQAGIMTTESFIRLDDLPPRMREVSHKKSYQPVLLDDVIKKHIQETLNKCEGNRSKTSKILGISRRALLRKIKRYSIQ